MDGFGNMSGANMNTNTNNNTENNSNNPENVEGGGTHESQHPTSREWVNTGTDNEKKLWWNIFRNEVLRKYNEQAIRPGTKINKLIKYKGHWFLNEHVMIDDNGNLVEAINNPYELQWKQDNTINDIDNCKFSDITTKDCFTKRLGSELCEDLGLAILKWDDCKERKLNDYLKAVFNILRDSNEMPKVRHRHKFLFWGNDCKSKTNDRWLVDYIIIPNNQKWGDLGNNDEERKEALVKMAIDEDKGKKLYKLLKIKGRKFEDIWNERVAVAPVSAQMTAIPPVVTPQTGVSPTTTPAQVEKYDQALINHYARARADWNNNSPCVTRAINKFFAKLFWPEQEYRYIFEYYDDIIAQHNLNSQNANNININNNN